MMSSRDFLINGLRVPITSNGEYIPVGAPRDRLHRFGRTMASLGFQVQGPEIDPTHIITIYLNPWATVRGIMAPNRRIWEVPGNLTIRKIIAVNGPGGYGASVIASDLGIHRVNPIEFFVHPDTGQRPVLTSFPELINGGAFELKQAAEKQMAATSLVEQGMSPLIALGADRA